MNDERDLANKRQTNLFVCYARTDYRVRLKEDEGVDSPNAEQGGSVGPQGAESFHGAFTVV